MRPLRTTLRNIGRFQSIELNLQKIPDSARIVAFDGDPGSGKSTLFRALTCGALFRKFRNSGTLAHMASGTGAMLETVVEHNGAIYSVKHLLSGKEGVSQLTKDGEAAHDKAKRKDFKATAEAIFPPELLLTNTIWRDQKSLGFLELDQAQRRDLIMMATGATKWQQWWEIASEQASKTEKVRSETSAQVRALTSHMEQMGNLSQLSEQLATFKRAVVVTAAAVNDAALKLESRQLQVAEYEKLQLAYDAECSKLNDYEQEVKRRTIEIDSTQSQLLAEESLLQQSAAIRSADATYKYNDELITEFSDQHNRDATEIVKLESELRESKLCIERLLETKAENETILLQSDQVCEAEQELPKINQQIADIEKTILYKRAELDLMRVEHLELKDTRIEKLRNALMALLEPQVSLCSLVLVPSAIAVDDTLAEKGIGLPAKIVESEKDLDSLMQQLAALHIRHHRVDSIAAKRIELQRANESLAKCNTLLEQNSLLSEDISNRLNHAVALDSRTQRALQDLQRANNAIINDAKKLSQLMQAEARVELLKSRMSKMEDELSEYIKNHPSTPVAPEYVPPVSDSEKTVLTAARVDHTTACQNLAGLEERINAVDELQKKLITMNAQLLAESIEASDWAKLAKLIGRDGIQSVLIDAAGPRLSDTVNYFLHTCFGNRWTQSISTQRLSSDGKKTIEQCQVNVIDNGSEEDNAPAREGEGITFSGGEQEILSLAFQLALAHLARDSGIINPDLFLDEPASALSESMRSKWVHMLRVAADLIGCKHIYIITHNNDVKRLADARIKLERGTARFVQGEE